MSQSDFSRVAEAIRYLCGQVREQPSLAEVAAQAGVSEFHFQRIFQKWAGVSPKRFLQYLTLRDAKELLLESRSVLEASLEVGLSSPSRLHDLFVSVERMTPGQFKEQGRGPHAALGGGADAVRPGALGHPGGPAVRPGLPEEGTAGAGRAGGALAPGPAPAGPGGGGAVRPDPGEPPAGRAGPAPGPGPQGHPVPAQGLGGPAAASRKGRVLAYGDLARRVGEPGASRAIGAAVGQNPVACLIPCHRVIQASGALGGYHWGAGRKRVLLALERARQVVA